MDKFQTLREKDNPSNNVYPNIQTQNIPDGGVTTAKIADGAITTSKIGTNAVEANNIAPYSVDGSKIAPLTISETKLTSSSVSTIKIASQAVTSAKIASQAVTTAKIAGSAVTAEKIAGGAINAHMSNEYWFKDTDFTELIPFIQWIEYNLKHNRKALYDDTVYMSTIDCVSTDQQEVTLKCSLPLQGINQTTTISTDADVVAFYNTTAGICLVFVGA